MFIGRTDTEAEASVLWPSDVKNWLLGKDSGAGEDWRQEEKGTTEDEMVGWHHWLNGHEFEQTLEDSEAHQGCSAWGPRVEHNWLNNNIFSFELGLAGWFFCSVLVYCLAGDTVTNSNKLGTYIQFCCYSVAKLCLTLQPNELHHTRLPCPSPPLRICSNLWQEVKN